MNLPIAFWIYLAAAAGATLGVVITSIIVSRKNLRLYNRGWNAGRDHALRTASLQTRQSS